MVNIEAPAFPIPAELCQLCQDLTIHEQRGMTLRDYFAAKAMQGMLASRNPNSPRFHPEDDAAFVYSVADAMLKQREKS